jgi:hypothetical protein
VSGQVELLAQRRQRVGGVQRQGIVSGRVMSVLAQDGAHRRGAAVVSFSGRAISS